MEVWNKITGMVTVELTSADPERLIGGIVQQDIPIWDVQRPSALTVTLRFERGSYRQVRETVERNGGKIRVLGLAGAYYKIRQW